MESANKATWTLSLGALSNTSRSCPFIHSDASQTSAHTFHFTVFNFTTTPTCTDVRLINFSLHIPPGALIDTSGSYYSQFLQSKPLFIHRHWPLRDKPGLQGQGTCGHLLINNTFRLQFCVHNVPITSWEKYVTRNKHENPRQKVQIVYPPITTA